MNGGRTKQSGLCSLIDVDFLWKLQEPDLLCDDTDLTTTRPQLVLTLHFLDAYQM